MASSDRYHLRTKIIVNKVNKLAKFDNNEKNKIFNINDFDNNKCLNKLMNKYNLLFGVAYIFYFIVISRYDSMVYFIYHSTIRYMDTWIRILFRIFIGYLGIYSIYGMGL